MLIRIEHKHTLATRWFHWVNFPLLGMMVWSGLLIYWANAIYGVGWGQLQLIHFFPKGFFKALGVPFRLAEGIALHFFFAWLFACNGIAYVGYLLLSGAWRSVLPSKGSLARATVVFLHDLHLVCRLPPQGKYNDAQRFAYTGVILMGAGSLATGLAIMKPLQLSWLTLACGGYEWARWEHFWLAIGFILFFVVHLLQVARAGWRNFQSMVTGSDTIATPSEGTNDPEKLA